MMTDYEKAVGLFGEDAFLVPCQWGTKKPVVTYVERPFEGTKTPAYVALFDTEPRNIAVYLGKASGGLCAIDFDADEDLAAFLAVNPKLGQTTRSRGSRGGMVWVRIVQSAECGVQSGGEGTTGPRTTGPEEERGQRSEESDQSSVISHRSPVAGGEGRGASGADYPASCTTAHFEWRADKRLSTISGRHPKGMDYSLVVDAPPVTVRFDEIVWPEGWELPWRLTVVQQLEREFGPALAVSDKGVVKLNQRFIVAKLMREHEVVYDDLTGRFYRYSAETGIWSHVSEVKIRNWFDEEFRRLIGELKVSNNGDPRLDNLYFSITQTLLRNLADMLKGAAAKSDAFHKPNRVLHAANGMVDLTERPFAFKGFSKEFYSRNQSPIAYDPAAKCPRFLNELLRPALDEHDITMLQNWCGLSLLGRNIPQVMMILSGTSGGGKGTTVNIIQGMIGERNIHQLRTEHLGSRFETSFNHDKTLLCGADVEPDFLNTPEAHHLKALTGNDLMTTEHKGSSMSDLIRGDFNILVTCNSRLMVKLQGDSEAWARRLLWIDFKEPRVAKPIAGFDAWLLRNEGSGILNWMLEGAVRLLAVLDANEPFPMTAEQRERVNNLLSESDAARTFIMTGVERSAFPLDCITSTDLFAAYLAFCDERGWSPLSQRAFEMKAKDLMVQIHRACPTNKVNRVDHIGGQRGYQGVVLKTAGITEEVKEGEAENPY
jgi:P4 family phage/plasmid primase-like protien